MSEKPDPNVDLARRKSVTLARVALASIIAFGAIGIGSALWGGSVFHSADLLQAYAPYQDSAPEGYQPQRPCVSDPVDNVLPASVELRRKASHGAFAQWDSFAGGGAPLGSVPSFAALSPLSIPAWILPPWLAPAYIKVFEIGFGALGLFLFLRRLFLTKAAALTGGLIFVSSGFLVVWTNWPQTRTATLIPWIFWAIERFVQRRSLRDAVPISIAVAAMFLGGFPSVTGFTLYAAVPYLILRCLCEIRTLERFVQIGIGLAAILAGAGLVAFQLLPFSAQLASLHINRGSTHGIHPPLSALVTLFAPNAFGACGRPGYFGPQNQIEVVAFVGAAALILVGLAILRGPSPKVPRGVLGFFSVATVMACGFGWTSQGIAFAQKFPIFSDNPVNRLRADIGFFLAVIAAIGFDRLQRNPAANSHRRWRIELIGWVGAALATIVLVYRNHIAYDHFAAYRFWDMGIPLMVGAFACVLVLAAGTTRFNRLIGRIPALIPGIIVVIVLVESATFARGFWPHIDRKFFYPTTSTHEFLRANSRGGERYVATGLTMNPGVNVYYGLSTPNGHGFVAPRWTELLRAIDPPIGKFTFTMFESQLELARVQSSILDRMAAAWLVTDPREPLYGTIVAAPAADTTRVLAVDAAIELPVTQQRLRGVGVVINTTTALQRPAWLHIDLLDAQRKVLATNRRRIGTEIHDGPFVVAELGEHFSESVVSLRLRLEGHGTVTLASDRNRQPVITYVTAADDHLELRSVGPANVWRRSTALARVRWASSVQMLPNAEQRIAWLAGAPRPEVIAVDRTVQMPSGKPALITRADTDGDHRRIDVVAEGSGYVVISDALTQGWNATVDGRSRSMVVADHAMVAVFVTRGRHTIVLSYNPPRQKVGLFITGGTVTALFAASFVRRRRSLNDDPRISELRDLRAT